VYGNAIESMNDVFSIQRIFVIFQKFKPKWHLSNQSPSINFRWIWFTCNFFRTNNITPNTTILNEDNGLNLNDEIKYIQECAIHGALIDLINMTHTKKNKIQLMLMLMTKTS
jgi:hypothetical protein